MQFVELYESDLRYLKLKIVSALFPLSVIVILRLQKLSFTSVSGALRSCYSSSGEHCLLLALLQAQGFKFPLVAF